MAVDTTTGESWVTMTTAFTYYDTNETIPTAKVTPSSAWEWYPLQWTWWLILQVVIATVGVVGNGLVMVVIYQRYAAIRSTDVFIGALSVGDFLTSIFMCPIPWAKTVPPTVLGRMYCKILYPSFPFWLCIVASTYILMAICIERYIALVFPLYFNRFNSKRKATAVVVGIWVLSVAQCLSTLFTFIYDDAIGYCASTIRLPKDKEAVAYYAFITRLVIPVLTMLVTQILVARSLHVQWKRFREMSSARQTPGQDTGPTFHIIARNRIIKMMLIVVLVYLITWTPNQVVYFLFNLGIIGSSYRGSPLHRVLTAIASINSCANPLIYAARAPEFRGAIRELLTCRKPVKNALFSSDHTATKSTYGVSSKQSSDHGDCPE